MKKAMMTGVLVMLLTALFGQQTHWTKADGFENNMTMSAVLYVDGTAQHLDQVEIGAFCGEECREAMLPYDIDGEMVYFLTISGNTGEEITFRLWDHETDSELEYDCETTYSFVANDVLGEYPDWYSIQFATAVTNFEVAAVASLEEGGTVSGAGTYQEGATATLTATASEGYAFVNWTENDEVVSTEATYAFTVTGATTLVAHFEAATPPSPGGFLLTIKPGWNWISYLLLEEMPLTTALENLSAGNGDMIKSQDGYSTYNASTGRWTGSLSAMIPGQGYIYLNKSSEVKTFSYPGSQK